MQPHVSLSMSLVGFYEAEYQPIKQLGHSRMTSDLYYESIRLFGDYLGRRALVGDLEDHVVAGWMQRRLAAGISPATVNKHLRHLQAIWSFACTYRSELAAPKVRKAKELCKKPRAWLLEEVGKLLHACGEEPGEVGGIPAGKFWRSVVLAIYDTGARKDVLLRLAPRHVDLSGCSILLPAELQKGGREQVVMLDPETAVLLAETWDPGRRFAFPWPYDRYPNTRWKCLNKYFRRIVARAEIPRDTRDLFHRLRKTHASYRERISPGSATKALGHSSARVTEAHYLDPRITEGAADIRLPRP